MIASPLRVRLALISCALVACSGGDRHSAEAAPASLPDASVAAAPRPRLCDRPGDDAVRDVFCAEPPPAIGSLEDLLGVLELDPDAFDPDVPETLDPSQQITALGHSTALSGHLVSPINPRLILVGRAAVLAFQRGVQRIELAAPNRPTGEFAFYLLTFEQACNRAPVGCAPGDLFTPAIERDWQRVRLEDDEDLKNTPSDCRQCHLRGSAAPQLLMRELESPWTHFFFPSDAEDAVPGDNGSGLMRDYLAAKGDERYGGVDLSALSAVAVFNLERVVGEQPLLFDAPQIEHERWPWTGDGYAEQAQDSPTWENAYQAFKRGEQLALPYVELRATDPRKQAALTEAYRRYREGEIDAGTLPDLSDIFPDDPDVRARIGLATEPDATPAEALIQACGPCHNDVLDQSISRARFNIALGRLSREEIDLAIARIELPASAPGAMPPREARQLAPEARRRLLEYLRSDLTREAIDPGLERAARLGMAGGGSALDAGTLREGP